MKKWTVPLCSCGRRHVYGGHAQCSACRGEHERVVALNPLCACGQHRPRKGNTACCKCRPRGLPCALCGTLSRGDVCKSCDGLLKRDERRIRVVQRLRKDGYSYADIGERMGGISRQRVQQIHRKEDHLARAAVAKALKNGRLEKPDYCERCHVGGDGLHAHHENYAQRLDVAWLCPDCHNVVHPHPGGPRGTTNRCAGKK